MEMQSIVHITPSENVKEKQSTEDRKQFSYSSPPTANTSTQKGQNLASLQTHFMADLSESDDEEVSEVDSFIIEQGDIEEDTVLDTSKFLLATEGSESPDLRSVDPETQARLEALLEAAGIGKLSTPDGKHLADPEVLRKLTSSVSCALDEAAAALTRMRAENSERVVQGDSIRSLAEACTDGDVGTVRKLLDEGRSVHETTEEGESLLSLACSAGYFELAQVLLAMRANVEDRGIKGDCTPLMEAASSGHADIVRLLIAHGADVNAQSSSGNTPLMYACAGGYEDVVKVLLDHGSNVEDHNENGHTPLMEAASAGHVNVARILLQHGAGINTHSNEFKESALTLACYKGHLEMVRFLLEAGADQEHKTDEMHTALMEASMDGHVDVARLLLDSGAQVNMPADSFESPLTLAACGGHVELAMLLLERGANIEEVNDEGYTPLMEAAREGHEEMVALLLSQGADINAQTEETQETALTLACCGGFLDVADFLIKAGADIELGASTPLMEAAQEGHLDLVRYLLDAGTNVHAQTQTGDTALTYACENGHTDVADLLLQAGANLEHQSEGGRTPLMKAARAGHLCTVQFLISRGADVNRQTTNNDHTPLSLACAGGHLPVVELLLAHGADPTHQLKDNSTMLIEAAKGGHIGVVQLLLDYPHNMMTSPPPPDLSQLTPPNMENIEAPRVPPHGLQVVVAQDMDHNVSDAAAYMSNVHSVPRLSDTHLNIRDSLTPSQQGSVKQTLQKQLLRTKNNSMRVNDTLTTAELQQIKNAPQIAPSENLPPDLNYDVESLSMDLEEKDLKRSERFEACINKMMKDAETKHSNKEEQIIQKQQILEELHRVERELQEKAQAQLLLNAAAAQHQQRLDHHQQQLHGNIPVAVTLSSSMSSPVVMTTAATIASSMVNPEILGMPEMTALGKLNNHVNIELSDTLNVPLTMPLPSDIMNVEKQKGKQSNSKKEVKNKRQHPQEHILSSSDSEDSTLSMSGLQIDNLPVEEQQLMNPEALQTLSLKAIAQSEHAGIIAEQSFNAAQAAEAKLSSEFVQNSNFNFFDATGTSQNLAAQSGVQALSISVASVTDKKSLLSQNALVQQTKNHLNTLDAHSFVGSIPLDSSGSIAHLTNSQQAALVNHQVAQQYISTNTVATQCIEQNLTPQAATNTLQLPFLTNTAATTSTVVSVATASSQIPLQTMPSFPALNVNSQTDSNRDTALTLACAGGHDDLVQLLLSRGANLEHRDKKGFTPLILAATAGHARVVEILLNHGADIEAQSERTKDTPLSLACSGGRYEVVELLLARGANKEHRNVSDYTPLSLAASGGYVNIIKLLLNYGAEINSRTNSKLGISPLMLAAMNGHTAAVKLLLDNGGDINAQIETNRNTALTLACFQGRHEVVSLLVDRKANVEHRAKTGLTPLMEAASGGYVEVGRVLLDKGADVNAPPVPSSRDTALTIAADKGHYRFVELLLSRGAQVDVKNKKGNSPLWLAANGGHLDVVQLLVSAGADIDSQDNRKVSCLMAAFRKGHIKVVKWMVRHVTQFPSDQEMTRFIATITDKDLMKKCHQCMENIRIAKDRQAVEANKYATILLEELDMEKTREESKKAAAARRRERKRKKKKEKQEKKLLEENKKNETKSTHINSQINENHIASSTTTSNEDEPLSIEPPCATTTTTIGTVITTTSKSSKQNNNLNLKNQTAKVKVTLNSISSSNSHAEVKSKDKNSENELEITESSGNSNNAIVSVTLASESNPSAVFSVNSSIGNSNGNKEKGKDKIPLEKDKKEKKDAPKENRTVGSREAKNNTIKDKIMNETSGKGKLSSLNVSCSSASTSTTVTTTTVSSTNTKSSTTVIAGTSTNINTSNKRKKPPVLNQYVAAGINDFIEFAVANENARSQKIGNSNTNAKKNELSITNAIENFVGLSVDAYEITNIGNVRNPSGLANLKSPPASVSSPKRGSKREEGWKEVVRRSKKVLVPSNAISRVIGRGGCNINAIREVSGAHIEVEKQKGAGDRTVIIKGSTDSTRQAHQLISALIKDPDRDLIELLPRSLANKSSGQNKAIYSASSNTSSQASSVTTCNTQSKVSLVAFSSSSSSSSSLSSSSSSSASVAAASSVSSLASRVNRSNSVTSNPTIGIYSTPPFPVSHQGSSSSRPTVPNASNSRPGIPVSPLSSAFANNNVPAWPIPNLASNLASIPNNSMSPKRITLIRSTSITTSTTNVVPGNVAGNLFGGLDNTKSSAVRQLFPNEKRSTVTTQSSNTNTKTTVSYTTAASSQGKTTITVSSNDASFASKVTKYKLGMNSVQNRAPGKSIGTNIRSAQSSPNVNQPTSIDPSLTITTNSAHMLNGPVSHTIGSQHRSQPNTPISTGSLIMSTHNSIAPGHPKPSAPQEYSPFNSFFSQVAQQSVWGKEKEGDNRGMNFASVAASNMKPIGSSIPNVSSVPVPVPSNESQPVDESKAPGYRGNSHISPSSNSASSAPISISSSNSLPNSAPNTPPIGPIAPPNSLVHSRRSPSPLIQNSPIGPGSLHGRSPIESPVLSNSAPVVSNVQMNAAVLQLSNLAPGAPPSMSSPNSAGTHNPPLNLLANQGPNMSPNLIRPLQLNPPTSNYPPASSPHAPSPRFSTPLSIPNTLLTQNNVSSISNSNSLPIQSNLNPNAPDFSSRAPSGLVNSHQPPLSFILNRLNPFGDGPTPPLSAFRPMIAVTSTTANAFPPTPLAPPQGGPNRLPFLLPLQQRLPSQPQNQQACSSSELSHQSIPSGSMLSGSSVPEPVRVIGNSVVFAHRQQAMGNAPVPVPIGPQAIGASLNTHYQPLQGQLLLNQRSVSSTPSMGTSSKDEESPIATISPVASPQTSNPDSPTGIGINTGSLPDHQVKAIGEDRKFLRPIGTERAHRKTPVLSRISDVDGIWSYPSGMNSDWLPNSEVQSETQENASSLYMSRFDDNLGTIENQQHGLETFQPAVIPPPSVATSMGINSSFPHFVNGFPPQMLSQLYGGANGNGLMNDTWPNSVKLGAGDSAVNAPGQTSSPNPHVIQEQKMVWNNWNQPQM